MKNKRNLSDLALNICEIASILLIAIPFILLCRSVIIANDATSVVHLMKSVARDIFIIACGAALLVMCLRVEKIREKRAELAKLEAKRAELEAKKKLEEEARKSGNGTVMGLGALAGLFGGMGGLGGMNNIPHVVHNADTEEQPADNQEVVDTVEDKVETKESVD